MGGAGEAKVAGAGSAGAVQRGAVGRREGLEKVGGLQAGNGEKGRPDPRQPWGPSPRCIWGFPSQTPRGGASTWCCWPLQK